MTNALTAAEFITIALANAWEVRVDHETRWFKGYRIQHPGTSRGFEIVRLHKTDATCTALDAAVAA